MHVQRKPLGALQINCSSRLDPRRLVSGIIFESFSPVGNAFSIRNGCHQIVDFVSVRLAKITQAGQRRSQRPNVPSHAVHKHSIAVKREMTTPLQPMQATKFHDLEELAAFVWLASLVAGDPRTATTHSA